VVFGAAALGSMGQERTDRLLAEVLTAGVNHIDTAADYGASEDRLAPFLAEHRDEVFLATKTGERTAAGARAGIERSLERMGVEVIDLVQLHNLVEPDEWVTAHGPGGALEALVAARDEGLVRYLGVTGHGTRIPRAHLRSLEAHPYDSVLFPFNPTMLADPTYRADVESLLEVCADRGVATQTIKSIARRRWPEDGGARYSWYEPLTDPDAIGRAVRYVLSHDQLFLNTTSDARLVPLVLDAAAGDLTRPSELELAADIDRFAMTRLFDGADLERI
jgi:aryl-alcohol dehydrogenase-like predicted oxidoreductase